MKPHESGYPHLVRDRTVTTETPPAASQVFRDLAVTVAVVVGVLALLVLGVYAVVAVDLMPQMTQMP